MFDTALTAQLALKQQMFKIECLKYLGYTTLPLPVVRRGQLLNYITHHNQSLVFGGLGSLDKFVVQVVGADGVGQLAEVHLEQ